ncbi:proline-specific peptidase [Peniophora sp. CONT]|nr:proline-specific peptidase [Peniophora sp. CONT]
MEGDSMQHTIPLGPDVREGEVAFQYGQETFETHYWIVGKLSSLTPPPLVVVHGAAGSNHVYMTPISDIATGEDARPVIFYDQVGAARSTHLPDKPSTFWTFDLFVAELQNLVHQLGVDDAYHLLGHSWGGQIAAELILRRHPKGLRSVVLSNTLSSSKEWRASNLRLARAMGDDVRLPFEKYEEDKNDKDEGYLKAVNAFYAAHGCRINPPPEEIIYSMKKDEWGKRVWAAIQETYYESWCIDDQIHLMDVPALLINGEFDFMTDTVCAPCFERMEKVKWVKFAHSSHTPFWEERDRYMQVVGSFLQGWD